MERVAVLNFGGQSGQAVVRQIRELGVYAELFPADVEPGRIKENLLGIVLVGDSDGVQNLVCDPEMVNMGVPVLGIACGLTWLVHVLGGKSGQTEASGCSLQQVTLSAHPLFEGVGEAADVWMHAADPNYSLPEGCSVLGTAEGCPVAAMAFEDKKRYGVWFHPEAEQSQGGRQLLHNFLYTVCLGKGGWTMGDMADLFIAEIQQQVGDATLLCALSGGVDSSVAATLVHRAIGDRLVCVFVDHGLMRKNEPEEVLAVYREQGLRVIHVNAKERFLGKLKGIADPEQKRKIIGEEFIRVFEEEARKLGQVDYLVQGTIYADVIESGIGNSALVKTHHNVGGLPEQMAFKGLVEPLRLLFKDEVRELGTALGLPDEMVFRQPFPGPGLGVRVLGEITQEKLFLVRESDAILREEIKQAGWERDIWQYFTVLLPVQAVGVRGDRRVYESVVAIRAIHSRDAMTARITQLPWDLLEQIGARIANKVPGVARVVYDITNKPPGTIEWE